MFRGNPQGHTHPLDLHLWFTRTFLSENRGELINEEFADLCQSFNNTVKTTAAEYPWSNDLIERYNLIIAEMLYKTMKDSKCDFDLAFAWCINAKNTLQNIHGFKSSNPRQ